MRTIKTLILILLVVSLNEVNGQEYGITKSIEIQSEELGQSRKIFVYTPTNYDENLYSKYDVIFVFDAQNKQFFDLTQSSLPFLNDFDSANPHIVVGITATWIDSEEKTYGRNDDLLPKPINVAYNKNYFGNANRANFFKYIEKEVLPYIENSYRTTSNKVFVGHSLSASFVISSFLYNSDLADAYIAISPNFSYDKDRLANEFLNFNYKDVNSQKYIYLSHSDEGIDFWKEWKPAREKVYNFLNDSNFTNINFKIDELKEFNHWTTFLPGLTNGLRAYFKYKNSLEINKPKKVKIKVRVPNKEDKVYISGNQKSLGNFQEGKILMNFKSDYYREIELELTSPADIRFVGGINNKKTEAILKNFDLNLLFHLTIMPLDKNEYDFEIIDWKK